MPAFTHHLFICGHARSPGHARGSCDPTGKGALRDAFKAEIKRLGIKGRIRANQSGCLDQCEHGPVVVIYPQAIWYGGVQAADVPRIVAQTLGRQEVLPDLLIADACLNSTHCPHKGRDGGK